MSEDLKKNEEKELELDDLLISNDEEDEKDGKSKKILLIGAIAIIVFAVVILVIYFLQGDDKKAVESPLDTQKQVEAVENNNQAIDTANRDFGQLPIQKEDASSNDEQFQKIIEQIKAQQGNAEPLPTPPAQKQMVNEKPKVEEKVQPQAREEIKQESKKPIQEVIKVENKAGFYVQVGSFTKTPNKKLLQGIQEQNYNYYMQKVNESTTRLLIGPFANKAEAQAQLANIKAKFNKDAFVKQIK